MRRARRDEQAALILKLQTQLATYETKRRASAKTRQEYKRRLEETARETRLRDEANRNTIAILENQVPGRKEQRQRWRQKKQPMLLHRE